jgi:hypothetical protein
MAQANTSLSTSVKIRFPRETLAALDDWAALNKLPRSAAVRRLVLRSLTLWEDDPSGYCDCNGDSDSCSGACK